MNNRMRNSLLVEVCIFSHFLSHLREKINVEISCGKNLSQMREKIFSRKCERFSRLSLTVYCGDELSLAAESYILSLRVVGCRCELFVEIASLVCRCEFLVAAASFWLRLPVFGCRCQFLVAIASFRLQLRDISCDC